MMPPSRTSEITAIGMAGRFPGASNPDELFRIILEKREALTTFPERELASLPFKDVAYIPKRGTIPDVEDFNLAELGLKERRSENEHWNKHPPSSLRTLISGQWMTTWNLRDKLANWLKNGRSHDLWQTSTNIKLKTEGSIFSFKFVYVWLVPSIAAKIEVDNIWCADVWMQSLKQSYPINYNWNIVSSSRGWFVALRHFGKKEKLTDIDFTVIPAIKRRWFINPVDVQDTLDWLCM